MAHLRDEIRETIICPGCQQAGHAIWESPGLLKESLGSARNLISLQGNFERSDIRGQSGAPLIVCGNCKQTLLG